MILELCANFQLPSVNRWVKNSFSTNLYLDYANVFWLVTQKMEPFLPSWMDSIFVCCFSYLVLMDVYQEHPYIKIIFKEV